MSQLSDFIEYLKAQVGEPYLWGGQHTKLTPEDYEQIIRKKETKGGYSDGQSYVDAAIEFCRRKFEAGATVLYAYDCSGLGCYWLHNLKRLYRSDVNANTMMGRCELKQEAPKRGWWVFRLDGKRAIHIGYMIDDQYLVEAKGRKYGVVRTKFNAKDWHAWGIPAVFKKEIEEPDPEPVNRLIEVLGKSVWVRAGDNTKSKKLFIAHRGDTFPYLGPAPSGWHRILAKGSEAFITGLPRYTRLV